MTENMKKFLETVSKSEELAKKINAMTKEELIDLAKELGIQLTGADFEKPEGELNSDELDAVAGGAACYCAAGGGGKAEDCGEIACACVLGGGGEFWGYENSSDELKKFMRCCCVVAGYGSDA